MLQDSGMRTANVPATASDTDIAQTSTADKQQPATTNQELAGSGATQHSTDKVLSPTGYILGFLPQHNGAIEPSSAPHIPDGADESSGEAISATQESAEWRSAAQNSDATSTSADGTSKSQHAQHEASSSSSAPPSSERYLPSHPSQPPAQQARSASSSQPSAAQHSEALSISPDQQLPFEQATSSEPAQQPSAQDSAAQLSSLSAQPTQQASSDASSQQPEAQPSADDGSAPSPASPSQSPDQSGLSQPPSQQDGLSTSSHPSQLPPHATSSRPAGQQALPAREDLNQLRQAQHAQHAQGLVSDADKAARSAAVKLLIAFMGALQASQYAVDAFVSNTIHYYRYCQLFPSLECNVICGAHACHVPTVCTVLICSCLPARSEVATQSCCILDHPKCNIPVPYLIHPVMIVSLILYGRMMPNAQIVTRIKICFDQVKEGNPFLRLHCHILVSMHATLDSLITQLCTGRVGLLRSCLIRSKRGNLLNTALSPVSQRSQCMHACMPLSDYSPVYRQGWAAQDLFDRMQEEEFAQSGGLLPYDPQLQPGRDSPPALIAELFAR